MSNYLLIGVGIFAVIMILVGLKRGLVKMAFSLISVLVVLILVNILTPSVKELLRITPVYTSINTSIQEYVNEHITAATENLTHTGVNAQKTIIDGLPLPKGVKQSLAENNNEQSYESMAANNFGEYIANSLSDMILGAATFIILFVVLMLLINVLLQVLNIITKLPVIHTFNSIGGGIIGLIEALIVIWIACIVITAFSATAWGEVVCKAIAENEILSFLYDNNLIQKIITGIFTV